MWAWLTWLSRYLLCQPLHLWQTNCYFFTSLSIIVRWSFPIYVIISAICLYMLASMCAYLWLFATVIMPSTIFHAHLRSELLVCTYYIHIHIYHHVKCARKKNPVAELFNFFACWQSIICGYICVSFDNALNILSQRYILICGMYVCV